MKLSRREMILLFLVAMLSITIFMMLDSLKPYHKATERLARLESSETELDYQKRLGLEILMVQSCRPGPGSPNVDTIDRSCFVKKAPEAYTSSAAIMFGIDASGWLLRYPMDREVRSLALQAVSRGRLDLVNRKRNYYDYYNDLDAARQASWIGPLVDVRYPVGGTLENEIDLLDRVEYMILQPEVAVRQKEWSDKIFNRSQKSWL